MKTGMGALSAAELADLAGATQAGVDRLVDLGVLVARDGAGPFLASDVQKLGLATACDQAGLPTDGIALAIRTGRLSIAFLAASAYRRWAVHAARTYRQVSAETGVPLETLSAVLESMGSPRRTPTRRCGRTSWSGAAAAARPVQRDPRHGLVDPSRPRLREGLRLAARVERE
jgi:hypothetical protein